MCKLEYKEIQLLNCEKKMQNWENADLESQETTSYICEIPSA